MLWKRTNADWLTTVCVGWSRILILSGAVFFNGNTGAQNPASLFDAYALLQAELGKGTYAA